MRLLLDTHVWVWSVSNKNRLSVKASKILDKADNELWLSPVSVWELLMLDRRGKLEIKETASAWIRGALKESGVFEATLTHEIALESECLALPHGDPADRFIVATAKVMGLVLVTADRKILSANACEVLEA